MTVFSIGFAAGSFFRIFSTCCGVRLLKRYPGSSTATRSGLPCLLKWSMAYFAIETTSPLPMTSHKPLMHMAGYGLLTSRS